jgi:hypothetical protein
LHFDRRNPHTELRCPTCRLVFRVPQLAKPEERPSDVRRAVQWGLAVLVGLFAASLALALGYLLFCGGGLRFWVIR